MSHARNVRNEGKPGRGLILCAPSLMKGSSIPKAGIVPLLGKYGIFAMRGRTFPPGLTISIAMTKTTRQSISGGSRNWMGMVMILALLFGSPGISREAGQMPCGYLIPVESQYFRQQSRLAPLLSSI